MNILIRESDDLVSFLGQCICTDGVAGLAPCVRIAVDLDDEPCSGTVEIGNEVANDVLPTKLEAGKLPGAKMPPESRLCRRQRPAQLPRVRKRPRGKAVPLSALHPSSPSP